MNDATKRPPVGMMPTERISYSPISETQAAEAAGRGPHGGVVHRQRRGVGHSFADAAHRADAAGRRGALARHPELGLARVRQPRRLLAHAQGVRRVQGAGDARDQRLGHRGLSADRRGGERTQVGVHRPRLHPAQHAEGGGRARRHPADARGHRAGLGQAAARLARAGSHGNLGDAGPAGGGRLRLCVRLGARRPAGVAEDARQADPQHPLHAGMQRRRHDADPASQGVGVFRSRARPVRADLCGLGGRRARDGAGAAPLHHGRGAPARAFPSGDRTDGVAAERPVLDRLADRRLVHAAGKGGSLRTRR